MIENLISIKELTDELYIHPMMQKIPIETIVRFTINFMRLMGVPNMFVEKCTVLDVKNYRAPLPCDFYKIIQVRTDKHNERGCGIYRSATDTFHMSDSHEDNKDLTYKIQNSIIYTSTKDTPIEIAYKAIATDEYGFPMIPDNSSYIRALKAFIKKEWFTIKFDLNEISQQSLFNAQQEYAFAAGDCDSEFNRMSLDEAESFYNMWGRMVVTANEHVKHFANSGTKEFIKIV